MSRRYLMTVRIKILGSPGTGKTTKIKEFYRKFRETGYKQEEIKVATFRKSVANELVDVLIEPGTSKEELKTSVGTIHSFCYRILGCPQIIKPKDYADFIKEFKYGSYIKSKSKKNIEIDDLEEVAYSGDVFDLYAWCKNMMLSPEYWYRYPGASNTILPKDRIPEFFKNFDEYKKRINRIDFTDMLQMVLDQGIQLDCSILMVDEFQDLTPQMNAVFEMWCKSCFIEKVVIAGDPFQSIYGFWGGSPDFFDRFEGIKIVLPNSHRLPQQIKDFSRAILRYQGMIAPDVTAKLGYGNVITNIHHSDPYPVYPTELHLIRANYQGAGIAMRLAKDGKVFGWTVNNQEKGWTHDEINLANAIISLKAGMLYLPVEQLRSIVRHFPDEVLELPTTKEEFLKNDLSEKILMTSWKPNEKVITILKSDNPTKGMLKSGLLFQERINGVKSRKDPIKHDEINNRRIMTIHAAKGLEADAVFLHTGITARTQKATVVTGKESKEESRVWYVGVTRARERLYLVQDEGHNYKLPMVKPAIEVSQQNTELMSISDFIDTSGEQIVYPDW